MESVQEAPAAGRLRKEVSFGPDNAMDGLARGAADGANGVRLGDLFGIAIVALSYSLPEVSEYYLDRANPPLVIGYFPPS